MYTGFYLKKFDFINEDILKNQYEIYLQHLNNLNELLIKNNFKFNISKEQLINNINDFNIIDRDSILYNLGGVINHERYFESISNNPKISDNKIIKKIENTYGSIENFENIFKRKAKELVGSGYIFLVLKNNDLEIIVLSNEDLPDYYGFKTLLTLDLYEHAYLNQYGLDKEKYIDNFLKHIDYNKVNEIYEK